MHTKPNTMLAMSMMARMLLSRVLAQYQHSPITAATIIALYKYNIKGVPACSMKKRGTGFASRFVPPFSTMVTVLIASTRFNNAKTMNCGVRLNMAAENSITLSQPSRLLRLMCRGWFRDANTGNDTVVHFNVPTLWVIVFAQCSDVGAVLLNDTQVISERQSVAGSFHCTSTQKILGQMSPVHWFNSHVSILNFTCSCSGRP